VPLFRLLISVTVVVAIIVEMLQHIPSWAMTALGYTWLTVLALAAVDAWRQNQLERAARLERERYGFPRR
jgi:hypothetical protein